MEIKVTDIDDSGKIVTFDTGLGVLIIEEDEALIHVDISADDCLKLGKALVDYWRNDFI